MAVVSVAPLFALRVFFDGNRLVRLSIVSNLDIGKAFAMAVARVRRRGAVARVMLAKLAGGQHRRLRLLRGRGEQRAEQEHDAYRHWRPADHTSNFRSAVEMSYV